MRPQELRFTPEHVWIDPDQPLARVGISDYAQKELTAVVYVELPEVGKEIGQGEVVATLESVKVTSDVHAPVSGKIRTVNSDLEQNPQTINRDPYGEGWLVEMKISEPGQLGGLMEYRAYQEYLESTE